MAGDGVPTPQKKWYQSVTIGAGAAMTGIQIAEQLGGVPQGTATAAANVLQAILGFLAIFGLRRAVGTGTPVQ